MELRSMKSAGFQEPSKSETGFEIDRGPMGNYTLKIWGRFPPSWIGNLSSGLSRNRISVISGTAKKTKTVWQAAFEIMATPMAPDPKKIDHISLATETLAAPSPVAISLDEFLLDEDPRKYDGAIYLEVKARDQLGFLGALLGRFAYHTLFPESMIIDTVGGRIYDRFWIKGVGGLSPSATSISSLRQKLESFLVK